MRLLSLYAVIALLVASCQADFSDEISRPKTYTSLKDFYTKNEIVPQQVKANSSNTIIVQGKKGSRFTFPANAFVTMNGQPVTGEVSLTIKEILTPADMILSNMPTMSDGKPLESGGQFFVRATKDGQELMLAPGKLIQVNVTNSSPAMVNMQVFNGIDSSNGNINWQLNTNQANRVERDTIIGYKMFASDINWLNIDKFINEPLVKYTINPGNCPDMTETIAFVQLTGRNSVLTMPKQTDQFYTEKLIAVPATIVAMCIKDGKMYYAISAVSIQDGGAIDLHFTETTEQALKDKLKTLK